MELSSAGWVGLGAALFLATFGIVSPVLLLVYAAAFVTGGVLVLYHSHAKKESDMEQERITPATRLDDPQLAVTQVVDPLRDKPKTYKSDKRLTGANIIDGELQTLMEFAFRDYIHPWYYTLSSHQQFLYEIRQSTQSIIITFATKSKEVDWEKFFTKKLVDDFASHLRLFRTAQEKIRKWEQKEDATENPPDLESVFFDLEVEMENDICRDLICTSEAKETEYLQSISEVLLFLLIPENDFHSKPFRFLLREIVACNVIRPLVERITDPDYINQTIIWMIKEMPFNTEAFLTIIKMCSTIEELNAMIEIIDQEIFRQRSRDGNKTHKDRAADSKQQLKSLEYVRKVCVDTIDRILSGEDIDTGEEVDEDNHPRPVQKPLYQLPLDIVLVNSIAVSYFIDFMRDVGGQSYVFFYHTVESYRVMAEQQLNAVQLQRLQKSSSGGSGGRNSVNRLPGVDLEMLRAAAMNIFTEYLSDDASNQVRLDSHLVKRTYQSIKNEPPSHAVFDEAQRKALEILQEERFFPSFKLSPLYTKCLAELDLLKDDSLDSRLGDDESIQIDSSPENSYMGSSEDISSVGSQGSSEQIEHQEPLVSPPPTDGKPVLMARMGQSTIVKEKGEPPYTLYTINVARCEQAGQQEIWDVYRRFSEFHDLHMCLTEKYDSLKSLSLPGKRAFNNTSKSFVQKRIKALNCYIQTLLNPEVLAHNAGMAQIVCNFLEPGVYNRGKGQLARRMDTFVNPLKTGVRNVAHTVKNVPSNLVDGVTMVSDKMTDTMNDISKVVFSDPGKEDNLDLDRVSSVINSEDDDNIPLRIMLLLMDEIFDLKQRDQWLRRQLVMVLRQIIKATYGNKINRQIVDSVEQITSAEQVTEYVKMFKESFWPNGILAEPSPTREDALKCRTRLATKAKMFSGIPDELKNFIGTETTRRGTIRVFDMLQHRVFNKRLFYVYFEGMLEALFPENKFREIFHKLHSQSPRIRTRREKRGAANSMKKEDTQSLRSDPGPQRRGRVYTR